MNNRQRIPLVSAKRKTFGFIFTSLVILLFIFSLYKLNLQNKGGIESYKRALNIIGKLFRMEFSEVKEIFLAAIQSLSVAFLATILSALLAFFVSFTAATNVSNNFLSSFWKTVTGVIRAVPTLIWTLVFVAYIGLGPFPGVLGLGFHSFAYLVKAYSQSIEEVKPGNIEALKALGANWIQTMKSGVFPPVKTAMLSWTALRFEINVGQSSILGLVGAGGIGQELSLAMKGFHFNRAGFIILVIFIMSFSIEMLFHRFKLNVDKNKLKNRPTKAKGKN